jgi:hypothetical protein
VKGRKSREKECFSSHSTVYSRGGGVILPRELISHSLHFSGVLTVRSQYPSGVCGGDHRAYSDVKDNTARTGRMSELSMDCCCCYTCFADQGMDGKKDMEAGGNE